MPLIVDFLPASLSCVLLSIALPIMLVAQCGSGLKKKAAKEPEQEVLVQPYNPIDLPVKPDTHTPLDRKKSIRLNKKMASKRKDVLKGEDNTDKKDEKEETIDGTVSKQGDKRTDKDAMKKTQNDESLMKKLPEVKVAKRADEIVTKGPVAKNRSDYKTLENLRGVGAQSFDQSLDL